MRFSPVNTAILFLACTFPCARALAAADLSLDPAAIAQLEGRAEHAGQREQCFLYTELVHVYTEVAGHQMAAGDMDQASTTLKRIQHYADLIHMDLARDTKKLKNAEMLVHSSTYHLSQYMHRVSSEDEVIVASTLKQLDKVHDELLAQVFAH